MGLKKVFDIASLAVKLVLDATRFTEALDKTKDKLRAFDKATFGFFSKTKNALMKFGSDVVQTWRGMLVQITAMAPLIVGAVWLVVDALARALPYLQSYGMLAYGAFIAYFRVQQQMLGESLGFTTAQMAELRYVSAGSLASLEKTATAIDEVRHRADEFVQSGGKLKGAFDNIFGNDEERAKQYRDETNPINVIRMLKQDLDKFSRTEKPLILKDLGADANVLLRITKNSYAEIERLAALGQATARLLDTSLFTSISIKSAEILTRVNDFMAITVQKTVPVFEEQLDNIVNKLTKSFDGQGGLTEGLDKYTTEWAAKITWFVADTIRGFGAFMDTMKDLRVMITGIGNALLETWNGIATVWNKFAEIWDSAASVFAELTKTETVLMPRVEKEDLYKKFTDGDLPTTADDKSKIFTFEQAQAWRAAVAAKEAFEKIEEDLADDQDQLGEAEHHLSKITTGFDALQRHLGTNVNNIGQGLDKLQKTFNPKTGKYGFASLDRSDIAQNVLVKYDPKTQTYSQRSQNEIIGLLRSYDSEKKQAAKIVDEKSKSVANAKAIISKDNDRTYDNFNNLVDIMNQQAEAKLNGREYENAGKKVFDQMIKKFETSSFGNYDADGNFIPQVGPQKPKPNDATNSETKDNSAPKIKTSPDGKGTGAKNADREARRALDLDRDLARFDERMNQAREKIEALKMKYGDDVIGTYKKQMIDEIHQVSDAYKAANVVVEDAYNRRLEQVKLGSAEHAAITKEMNDKIVALNKEREETITFIQIQQEKRRQQDLKKDITAFDDKIKDFATKFGVGEKFGANQLSINEQLMKDLDDFALGLDDLAKRWGLSEAEVEKLRVKVNQLKEEAKDAFPPEWGPKDPTDTIGNATALMMGHTEEMYTGIGDLRVKDFENAKGNKTKQVELMMGMGSEVLSNAAKTNKKAFMMKKALDAGMAVTAAFAAATEASKWGATLGPSGAAAASALTLGLGLANAAMILAQPFPNVQGQAHDGINFIPNEGTWNLAKGERVVGAALNRDLTNFINQQPQQSRTSTINAPLTIQGNVYDEGWFMSAVQRHSEQIVRVSEEYKSERGY